MKKVSIHDRINMRAAILSKTGKTPSLRCIVTKNVCNINNSHTEAARASRKMVAHIFSFSFGYSVAQMSERLLRHGTFAHHQR